MSKRKATRLKAGRSGKQSKARDPRAAAKEAQEAAKEAAESSRKGGRGIASPDSIRETIESVVIAFVLAFLFRTFEAEAFVIPTGSMAPTLMGRHKDLDCPECGYRYQVGDSASSASADACSCPMCMFPTDLSSGNVEGKVYESYNGDRILVNKFCYEYEDPKRWDVAVFKFPADAPTNYIKRLVGLPGDKLTISNGDIFLWNEDENRYVVERKPPRKQLAMLQSVFDNDVMDRIAEYGWPARWNNPYEDASDSEAMGNWVTSEDFRSFSVDGTFDGEAWMRYEHRVPTKMQWGMVRKGNEVPESMIPPRLITDFYAYNSHKSNTRDLAPLPVSDYWVGDLAMKCRVDIESDSGIVIFDLVEGFNRYECRINIADGKAALSIDGVDSFAPVADTAVRPFGSHEIIFANCDDELRLWIDGDLVEFDAPTTYAPPTDIRSTNADLSPAGIGSLDAAMRVSELELLRDIYYTAGGHKIPEVYDRDRIPISPSDPRYAAENGPAGEETVPPYILEEDQFFMLGDNSPCSKDSRLWDEGPHYVHRDLMIGKAVFIYWPHSWDRIPGTNIPFPYFPNFGDMGLVR